MATSIYPSLRNEAIFNIVADVSQSADAWCKSSRFVSGYTNECSREAEKDSLNEEQGIVSDSQEVKFSMTPSPKLRSSRKLLGLLTQNRSHLFLSSYPL